MSKEPTLAVGLSRAPVEVFDVALLDLDGVVYLGAEPVTGVPSALAAARLAGLRLGFVTNNASRSPDDVAAHLTAIGVPAQATEVITSSQAAATVVLERFGRGAAVLPVGGPGVAAALRAAGLVVVDGADQHPVAVVQGFGPEVCWADLAEAVVAVGAGARHVATNADATIPTTRGRLPGNGALVGVVSAVTGQAPLVTGKPDPAMHAECVRRTAARRPLVVGDRLDTDIEGAQRAGAPALLVLSGVTDPAVLLAAPPEHRPQLVSADAAGLLVPHPPVLDTGGSWHCGAWTAEPADTADALVLRSTPGESPGESAGDGLDWLRATCVAHWSRHPDAGAPASLAAADDAADRVLDRWGLGAG